MKRYGNLYHLIYDIENIKLAHINARKGKRFYKEVQMVDANLEYYAYKIQDMIINKTFKNSSYEKYIKKDKGKEREIFKLPYYPDRIVHHAIMQILEPIWRKTLITDTYQSIKGRGVHKLKNKLQKIIRTENVPYCLKVDVKKFYPSIDNEILKNIIRNKIKCKDTLWLLDEIIDSIDGVPIGNYLSQYFGNLYLSKLDHYIKENMQCKFYFRYCDDIILLSNNKDYLHKCLYEIKMHLNDLNLELKGNYQIFQTYIRGVDFVGFRFFKTYTLLRKSIAKNLKSVFRKDKMSAYFSLISYWGWAKSCDAHNLWRLSVNKYLGRNK